MAAIMTSFCFLLLLLPLLFVSGSADSDSCFFPNGKHAGSSASCWETNGNQTALCCQTGDLCLNNNVCAVKSRTGTSSYYRGSCIDSTWSNPKCPPGSRLADALARRQAARAAWGGQYAWRRQRRAGGRKRCTL
ncbi:uncharacterized protein P884DRAFT_291502 [Thermothelomyces heterothallicus CBS 202.75]|uniref:uncharacterized protein n=1 Tax=Thermothelomyces heterothallicus CBS 202.75 TaxID=1149848 RepID=UPI0037448307